MCIPYSIITLSINNNKNYLETSKSCNSETSKSCNFKTPMSCNFKTPMSCNTRRAFKKNFSLQDLEKTDTRSFSPNQIAKRFHALAVLRNSLRKSGTSTSPSTPLRIADRTLPPGAANEPLLKNLKPQREKQSTSSFLY